MLLNAANNALRDAGHAESCRITEVCKTYSHLKNLDPSTVAFKIHIREWNQLRIGNWELELGT